MPVNSPRKYHNIMEDMVAEEVRRQVAVLSPRLSQYIKRVDVETYALNRLPPLYACSQEGWLMQNKRAKSEYLEQVKTVVRQALMAVQRDLLRHVTPLIKDEEEQKASPKAAKVESPEQHQDQSMASWRHSRYYRIHQNTNTR